MADRYWIATSQQNANDSNYWSTTSGGSGGASVPGANDSVFLDANGPGDLLINTAFSFLNFDSLGWSGNVSTTGRGASYSIGVNGGSIARYGTGFSGTRGLHYDVSDIYVLDSGVTGIYCGGTCTLHQWPGGGGRVYFQPLSTASTVTLGNGPFYFNGVTFGDYSRVLTFNSTAPSELVFQQASGNYEQISFRTNITFNNTATIKFRTVGTEGNSYGTNLTLAHIGYVIPWNAPVILDTANFANPLDFVSMGSTGFSCEYLRDCQGHLQNVFASPITETGTDPSPCKDTIVIKPATVQSL